MNSNETSFILLKTIIADKVGAYVHLRKNVKLWWIFEET